MSWPAASGVRKGSRAWSSADVVPMATSTRSLNARACATVTFCSSTVCASASSRVKVSSPSSDAATARASWGPVHAPPSARRRFSFANHAVSRSSRSARNSASFVGK